jgi:hypothetical protein
VAVCGEDPKVTLGARVQIRPAGEDSDDSVTVPVNPLTAATVIVEVPELPAEIWAGDTALAAIVKSTKWNVMGPTLWLRVPSVPVTVAV